LSIFEKKIMKRTLGILLFLPFILKGQIITTVAGNGSTGYSGDLGQATAAKIQNPNQLALDNIGNLYIVDQCNNVIRKVNTSGIISTFAGTGYEAGSCGSGDFSGDGAAATAARFRSPYSVTVDPSGSIYIGDDNNEIRKVNTSGIINRFAGQGPSVSTDAAYNGEGGQATAVDLIYPLGLAADPSGNIFYIDGNDYQVRMINTSGIVKTIAGTGCCGGYTGDNGPGTAAQLNNPTQIAVDNSGNVYIADKVNAVIRKVNSSGIITTFAGNGGIGYSGDGGPATDAKLWGPTGVATDASGNVYIADNASNRIRKVTAATNIITTIAGTGAGPGAGGYTGDNGPATAALLNGPSAVVVDASGNVYFTDYVNQVIRKISIETTGAPTTSLPPVAEIKVFPNPANDMLTVSSTTDMTSVSVSNLIGAIVRTLACNSGQIQIDVADLPTGMYLVRINGSEVRKFVKQ
jgi:streptogramin lyase